MRNTTEQFSASPGLDIMARTPHDDFTHLSADVDYSDGPQCVEFISGAYPGDLNPGPDYLAFRPGTPLAPGDAITVSGFFILKDYFSPAHPHGDSTAASSVILTLEPQAGGQNFGVSSSTGTKSAQTIPNAVPLLPGGSGGCLLHPPCGAAFNPGNLP